MSGRHGLPLRFITGLQRLTFRLLTMQPVDGSLQTRKAQPDQGVMEVVPRAQPQRLARNPAGFQNAAFIIHGAHVTARYEPQGHAPDRTQAAPDRQPVHERQPVLGVPGRGIVFFRSGIQPCFLVRQRQGCGARSRRLKRHVTQAAQQWPVRRKARVAPAGTGQPSKQGHRHS